MDLNGSVFTYVEAVQYVEKFIKETPARNLPGQESSKDVFMDHLSMSLKNFRRFHDYRMKMNPKELMNTKMYSKRDLVDAMIFSLCNTAIHQNAANHNDDVAFGMAVCEAINSFLQLDLVTQHINDVLNNKKAVCN